MRRGPDPPIVVVGAGLAGLTAARALVAAGERVQVVDKGRSVGGRLATRRIGGATLDHGAQFFTVRTDAFAAEVDRAVGNDVAYEWCRGFTDPADGHPRYAVRGGMNRLAKHLAAGLEVMTATRISAVSAGEYWAVEHDGGLLQASAVVLTAPMPQNL
ncbi:MAG: NAD(P)-binding protein, partial [Acidimicrobiia bacterium]|nr:NAD(P)-binding protein [Acidimicrobiia bacterium]